MLNTGTTAAVPPIPGLADTPFWTNREALKAEQAPASLIVIGGGAIGLELAQAYARFDTEVTVLEVAPRILAPEEPESSELLAKVFEAEGIGVHAGITIDRVDHDGSRFTVTCGDTTYEAEQLLVAAGRTSRLDDIGLDTVGVEVERFLTVGDDMQVKDGLWAIGDIVGRGAFTHLSMYHAERAAKAILGEPLAEYDASFPRVTFTDPEVGGVGVTEAQARDKGLNVRVGLTDVSASSRGFVHGIGNEGLIKLVIDADRDVIVGATSAGPTGGETLSALAVRGARRDPARDAAQHGLRLPDVLAGDRVGALTPRPLGQTGRMRITVLSGGVGGANFLSGLLDAVGPDDEVTVIGNTADDIWLFGLRVCPDLDTVMYTLGGGIDPERKWGRTDETWNAKDELTAYGVDNTWFGLGDRDLATHLIRTQLCTRASASPPSPSGSASGGSPAYACCR